MDLSKVTLEELQKANPDLIKAIEDVAVSKLDKEKLTESVNNLKQEVADLTKNLEKASEEKNTIQGKLDEAQGELDKYQEEEKKAAKEKHIEAMLGKYSLSSKLVSQKAQESWLEMEDADIEADIKERSDMIKKAKEEEANPESTVEEETEEEKRQKQEAKATQYDESELVSELTK